MAINYTTLRTEVETATYATWRNAGDDSSILAYLNLTPRAGAIVTVVAMDFNAFQRAMVAFLSGLATAQATQMLLIGQAGVVYLADTATRTYLEGVYNATAAKNALQALYTRTGSRAEVVLGDGAVLTMDDLMQAKFLNGAAGW